MIIMMIVMIMIMMIMMMIIMLMPVVLIMMEYVDKAQRCNQLRRKPILGAG